MGKLHRDRVQRRPFLNTGIDYCGPFFIKVNKHGNRHKIKVYVRIFVCFATEAIHIELAFDLSTETFIGCLRRFFARSGRSSNLYLDNAINFTGTKNKLDELMSIFNNTETEREKLNNFFVKNCTAWHFILPRAPHFG